MPDLDTVMSILDKGLLMQHAQAVGTGIVRNRRSIRCSTSQSERYGVIDCINRPARPDTGFPQ
jgi:hypothetical protein